MLLVHYYIACFSACLASLCIFIGIDVLHFEFGGMDLTGILVVHDISFDLERNYFGTGDGGDDRGTLWTISLIHSPILATVGPIAASDDMGRGRNG